MQSYLVARGLFTTDDWTCYHMTVPSTALARAVEIEADRFQNLNYDEAAFQKEARAVLGEAHREYGRTAKMLGASADAWGPDWPCPGIKTEDAAPARPALKVAA